MPFVRSTDTVIEASTPPSLVSYDTDLPENLRSGDITVRRAAVRLAGRMGEAGLLAGRLDEETDQGIRETILTSLVRIGTIEAARPLLVHLRSEDAHLRNAVVETLQSMGDIIIPEIEHLLESPDSDIRIFAMNIVVSLRSPRAPALALKVIESDPHVNVCAAAVDVLAEVGGPEMADALRDAVKRFPDYPFLAYAVRAALKRIE